MVEININYLANRRGTEYQKLLFHFLKLVSPDSKSLIRINLLVNDDSERWKELQADLTKSGINTTRQVFPSDDNYMRKIRWASEQDSPYSIKMDEDCIMGEYMWDYFLEHMHRVLMNDDNLVYMPTLSNGIPSCDFFVDYMLNEEERNTVHKLFLETSFPNIWGFDYVPLNSCTKLATTWNYHNFLAAVRDLPTPVKGIHPVRVHSASQKFINDMVVKYLPAFVDKRKFEILTMKCPYFCNSFFAIKTATWRDIINTRSLFQESEPQMGNWAFAFDELPINSYMRNKNLNACFVVNGFAIHTMYNTLYGMGGGTDQEGQLVAEITKFIHG